MITGKTLIELGYNPAKWFKAALKYLNENEIKKEDVYLYINQFIPKKEEFILEESTATYFENIIAKTKDELANLSSVKATMNEVMKSPTIINGAIMPDACPAGPLGCIPVGGIVVAKNAIHPEHHSADICCSVMCTSFGNIDPKRILDLIHKVTDFGKGPRKSKINTYFELPNDLKEKMASNHFFDNLALAMAKSHLGTQGDGNHFAFVGISKNTGETCLVTHHGSRGVGAKVFKKGIETADYWRKRLGGHISKLNAWIPYDTVNGVEYWNALQLIREWTKLNHSVLHNWIVDKVKYKSNSILNFWNEHNFVFKEDDLFYHAKGATPLDNKFVPDSVNGLRLIPLNMSEPILIVKGATTKENLGFAPHGAGRNLSRTQHKLTKKHVTTEQIFKKETNGLDIRFYSGSIDISELPSAYKNANDLKEQMKIFNLGDVIDEIMPYGCIMAGENFYAYR